MTDRFQPDRIRAMFDQIAPGYDRMNTVFSLDRDRAWRRRAATLAGLRSGGVALDLCTGTGKLAHELLPYVTPGGTVIGLDFSGGMLERARQREPGIVFLEGDATALPFDDATIDAVTIAFGFRNLADRDLGLREMRRVLRGGGRAVILELSPPPGGPLSGAYRLYLSRVMPAIAGAVRHGDDDAYAYLSASVQAFPSPTALRRQMEAAGFQRVQVQRMTLGIVAIHVGVKDVV
jgi:demethylmenaquinone methyltransferase/2-methoxy-6-polyprenyl-1,4-benzoquinol methylase